MKIPKNKQTDRQFSQRLMAYNRKMGIGSK